MQNIIKEYRRIKDMTQQQLADAVGMSREHIARIENGNANMSLDTADAIAAALDVSIYALFCLKSNDANEREKDAHANARVTRFKESLLKTAESFC